MRDMFTGKNTVVTICGEYIFLVMGYLFLVFDAGQRYSILSEKVKYVEQFLWTWVQALTKFFVFNSLDT